MNPTNNDLHRDIGRMEGRLGALENRLEKMEAVLERIDARLAKIEVQENERKGAWKVIVAVSGGLSAIVASIVTWFFK